MEHRSDTDQVSAATEHAGQHNLRLTGSRPLTSAELDPLRSLVLQRTFAGLEWAYDSTQMRPYLQAALFRTELLGGTMVDCEVEQATGDSVLLWQALRSWQKVKPDS